MINLLACFMVPLNEIARRTSVHVDLDPVMLYITCETYLMQYIIPLLVHFIHTQNVWCWYMIVDITAGTLVWGSCDSLQKTNIFIFTSSVIRLPRRFAGWPWRCTKVFCAGISLGKPQILMTRNFLLCSLPFLNHISHPLPHQFPALEPISLGSSFPPGVYLYFILCIIFLFSIPSYSYP